MTKLILVVSFLALLLGLQVPVLSSERELPSQPAEHRAEAEALWIDIISDPWNDPRKRDARESEAYTQTHPAYVSLIEDLRHRARQEGWQCH